MMPAEFGNPPSCRTILSVDFDGAGAAAFQADLDASFPIAREERSRSPVLIGSRDYIYENLSVASHVVCKDLKNTGLV